MCRVVALSLFVAIFGAVEVFGAADEARPEFRWLPPGWPLHDRPAGSHASVKILFALRSDAAAPDAAGAREQDLRDALRTATPPVREWSRLERGLAWTYVALNAVDAYQTSHAPGGVREANPLLSSWAGDHPSEGEVVLFRAATTWGILEATRRWSRTRRTRRTVLVLINLLQFAAVAHNEQVSGGIAF